MRHSEGEKRRRLRSPGHERDRERSQPRGDLDDESAPRKRLRRSLEEDEKKRHRSTHIHGHSHNRGHDHDPDPEGSRHHPRRLPVQLPYSSRLLSKADFKAFKPLFAQYLEVQKNKKFRDLDEREVRGRWKSFLGKWNDGSLAEGWYDPEVFQQAALRGVDDEEEEEEEEAGTVTVPPVAGDDIGAKPGEKGGDGGGLGESADEDDDGYGPRLPHVRPRESGAARQGPGIPSLQDLEYQREMAEEDRLKQAGQLRLERKADRSQQKAQLDDLLPRAEAGTRERQLEKKKEVNDKMKQFREKDDGALEVKEEELMGGGDSVNEFKRIKAANERRKTERELRREEIQRARLAEIEERRREYKEKEDHTMVMLKELARQKFG